MYQPWINKFVNIYLLYQNHCNKERWMKFQNLGGGIICPLVEIELTSAKKWEAICKNVTNHEGGKFFMVKTS